MSDLDELMETIRKAKESKGLQDGLSFEFENVDPTSWSDFVVKTDIGRVIGQNAQVFFKDAYGKRTRGTFIKLDDETFCKIQLTGNERSDKCGISISFIPKERLKDIATQYLIDYDREDYQQKLEKDIELILNSKDFNTEFIKDRKKQLFETLKEIKTSGNKKVMSNEDIDLLFEMVSQGELAWSWLGDDILHTPQFKNNLINYVINESPKDGNAGRSIENLISMDDGGHQLEYRDYFFDEDILENEEFIDNLNRKFFNGKNYSDYNEYSKYNSATEAITFSIFSKYHKDGSFENREFSEEKIDFISKLVKENDGDLGFLKGAIPYIVGGNIDCIDKILSVSTDPEIISKIMENVPDSAFENPEFLSKILPLTTDQKVIKKVLSKMSNDDKTNPEIMLRIIEACPNVLEVFKENYDNWDGRTNLFYKLESNEEFQKGLIDMCKKLIQESEIETIHHEGRIESVRRQTISNTQNPRLNTSSI